MRWPAVTDLCTARLKSNLSAISNSKMSALWKLASQFAVFKWAGFLLGLVSSTDQVMTTRTLVPYASTLKSSVRLFPYRTWKQCWSAQKVVNSELSSALVDLKSENLQSKTFHRSCHFPPFSELELSLVRKTNRSSNTHSHSSLLENTF